MRTSHMVADSSIRPPFQAVWAPHGSSSGSMATPTISLQQLHGPPQPGSSCTTPCRTPSRRGPTPTELSQPLRSTHRWPPSRPWPSCLHWPIITSPHPTPANSTTARATPQPTLLSTPFLLLTTLPPSLRGARHRHRRRHRRLVRMDWRRRSERRTHAAVCALYKLLLLRRLKRREVESSIWFHGLVRARAVSYYYSGPLPPA